VAPHTLWVLRSWRVLQGRHTRLVLGRLVAHRSRLRGGQRQGAALQAACMPWCT
jgi:hypothetical protein